MIDCHSVNQYKISQNIQPIFICLRSRTYQSAKHKIKATEAVIRGKIETERRVRRIDRGIDREIDRKIARRIDGGIERVEIKRIWVINKDSDYWGHIICIASKDSSITVIFTFYQTENADIILLLYIE